MERFLFNMRITWEALMQNKVRSFLTALGIIFGVASVISMQAIGRGAQQKILEQIKLVGVNNIIIEHKKPQEDKTEPDLSGKAKKEPASLGLSIGDGESILQNIPEVSRVSPESIFDVFAIRKSNGKTAKLIGVDREYFDILSMQLDRGRVFNTEEMLNGAAVCVISADVKKQFFGGEDPIGKPLKCGTLWLTVIGILEGHEVTDEAATSLKLTAIKLNVYAPVTTVLLRFENRGLLTKSRVEPVNNFDDDEDQQPKEKPDYHQVDKIIVQVTESKYVGKVAEVAERMLKRRHNGADDFTITIPERELKHEQETKDTFNLVLGVIAAISLLVGGIGIMNIMLVSVVERMKEIGIRQALGATRVDIVFQFLAEAVLISLSGGILGILLGIGLSQAITLYSGILTIITLFSVLLSFLVSATVGLAFGVAPARKAANQDPVESLRHE